MNVSNNNSFQKRDVNHIRGSHLNVQANEESKIPVDKSNPQLRGPSANIFIHSQRVYPQERVLPYNRQKFLLPKVREVIPAPPILIQNALPPPSFKSETELKKHVEENKDNVEKNKAVTSVTVNLPPQLAPLNPTVPLPKKEEEAKVSQSQFYLKNEKFVKLDYSDLDETKKESYELMKGKYSSLRPNIAYINPKANEPHELIEGRPPRKVMIDRMKKVYATINIETLLKEVNIDFTIEDPLESWLPLHFFEDKELDIFTAEEWINKAKDKDEGTLYIQGVGLHRDKDNIGKWRRVLINNYNKDTEKYEGVWDEDKEEKEPCSLSKIYLLFDAENPFLFCKKVSQAAAERKKAESIIRYNLYIDKMGVDGLQEINEDIKKRLQISLSALKTYKESIKDSENLFRDLSSNYLRTTNKIIFDKFYYSHLSDLLIIQDLELPPEIINNPDIHVVKAREKGLEQIPSYNYISSYKQFTFHTLLCRKEIIECLQKIQEECNKIKDCNCIFNLDVKRPMRLLEFKSKQKNSINNMGKKMDEWVKVIKDTLEKSLTGVGKGSFNLGVKSKEIYEYLKLKKYMTVVKCLMQDILYSLITKSMTQYVNFFKSYIPETVEIKSVSDVKNNFIEEEKEDELNTTLDLMAPFVDDDKAVKARVSDSHDDDDYYIEGDTHPCLFSVNLTKKDDKTIEYTTKEEDLIKDIMQIFDDGLERMQKISQVEPLLLPSLIKAGKNGIPLKTITRPKGGKPAPKTKSEIHEGFELNEDAIWIWEKYETLIEYIKKACEPLKPYLATFEAFKEYIELDPNQRMKEIRDEESKDPEEKVWTFQKIEQDIIKNREIEQKILTEIPKVIHLSFFLVNCKEYRNDLANKFNKLADLEIDYLKEKAKEITGSILNGYAQMTKEITAEVVTINDLKNVQNFIDSIPTEIQKLSEQTNQANVVYKILEKFYVKLDYIQFQQKMDLIKGPTDIENTKNDKLNQLTKKKEILAEEQEEDIKQLHSNIKDLEANIFELEHYKEEKELLQAKEMANYIKNKLKEYKALSIMYSERQALFDKPKDDWSKIAEIEARYTPYYNLWIGIDVWLTESKKWMEDEFSKLNGTDVDNVLTELTKNFKLAYNKFNDPDEGIIIDPKLIAICSKYKDIVEHFRPTGDLAVALTRGLKDRHWEEIKKETNIDCTPREGLTFKEIIDNGMLKHLEACIDVGEKAFREAKIEDQLNAVEKKWKEIFFGITEHKTTGIPIIANWNDINKELDTDIMEIQQLDLSPFKGPFSDKILEWSELLLKISQILEEWNKCQKSWIYLQPVFDSGDIAKDIPAEHKKFKMTDRMWRDLMTSLKNNRQVRFNCSQEGLSERLKEANMNLENVEKGLNRYMENKRKVFPRFFFISNAQFLEILSQTNDIKKLKDTVNKIFEPIDHIEIIDNKYIGSYYSRFDENLKFEKNCLVFGRNVEIWMSEFEELMFKSVRTYMENAVNDYMQRPRKDWVKFHPSQILMAVSQIMWSTEMEKNINAGTLPEYIHTYNERIQDLVAIVREKQSRVMSISLANLITLDVHNRNVMNSLVQLGVKDIKEFDWIKNLRYYWNNELKPERNDCVVKSVQTDFPYGYEYVGNAEILVITPLTDKCNLTLMGALRLNLGGAPAGPAGTGKTETTKDLARTTGKLCIVYNCSDDTEYVMIGKFFKGLACCGAWICFDEFNRINIEVLSVIAQQLLTLFGAKAKGLTEVVFEESEIKIQPTFCVFITMNPGYAGRTELPDNLKALFRSISMMVPDYKLIAEINLYSSGYTTATNLATKVVSTMKLSSEQLSSQSHYDYGMRAVKSVLNAARRLKRTELETPEDQLVLRALEDVNVPKFLSDDILLFRNIICDLFPDTQRPKINYDALLAKVDEVCEDKNYNLVASEGFKAKIIQLYDTLQVRHGLMIVGPAGGGKSSNYRVLKEAQSRLADGKTYFKTMTNILNPKAVTHGELYSEQKEDTGDWTFGIVPTIINTNKQDTSGQIKYWLIFDGPVDAMWIEDMNSVLDDSKKLCLASSDIILLNDMITIMFEVEDLRVASPATVSRCGMVYMEPSSIGIQPLYLCWIKAINNMFSTLEQNNASNANNAAKPKGKDAEKEKKDNKKEKMKQTYISNIITKLTNLFNTYLEVFIDFIRRQVKEVCPTVDNNLAYNVMRIIDTFFDKFRSEEAKFKNMTDDIKKTDDTLEGVFYFAMIWGLGATTNEEGRKKFDSFFRKKTNESAIDEKFLIPKDKTVYDYLFDPDKGEWIEWLNIIQKLEIPPNTDYTEIIVPTPDSVRNSYVIKQLILSNKHVITTGPTGTGKTVNIMEVLSKGLGIKYMSILMNFSAQTTAKQVQDSIQGKVKKRGRNRFAPEKPAAIFIDDLNMPVQQTSGAQPPIEILRQWLDHSGWYNLFNKTFITIENIILLGSMGVPGGGKNFLSQRFQRHFNLLAYNELDDVSVKMIFSTILNHFLYKFSDEIKANIDNVIMLTLMGYNEIKKVMLPTPSKMHYIFNLRDISKVLQGVSSVNNNLVKEKEDLAQIWAHEMTRVFGDRFINDEDRKWLRTLIIDKAKEVLQIGEEELFKYGKTIIFCDFMNDKRIYQIVKDPKTFKKKIEDKLAEYSTDPKRKKLNLVMFLDACDHVARISRILRQPRGNALLLGVGGSGRQSLARLATFINDYTPYQIDVVKGYGMADFSKNVKECLKNSGIQKTKQTFLMVDTQIIDPLMLEYINGILNTGDVPNIYDQSIDKEDIFNSAKDECNRRFGNLMESNIMKVYLDEVQKNIHVVLAMSPLGTSFINRLRMFPALVSCCTLDWFSEWPEDALESVAMDNFHKDDLGLSKDTIPKIVEAFKYIHKRVELESKEFSSRLRRHVYLTPTSYLELLELYKKISKDKKDEFKINIDRFENGLKVLESANEEVAKMRKEIEAKQPELEASKKQAEELSISLKAKTEEANKEKAVSEKLSIEASAFAEECSAIKKDCEIKLKEVEPLIKQALDSINKVQLKDLREQANYKQLIPRVSYVFECLLYFLEGNKWKLPEYLNKEESAGKKEKVYRIKDAIKYINFNQPELLLERLKNICEPGEIDKLKIEPKKSYIDLMNEHISKYKNDDSYAYEELHKASACLPGLFSYLTNLAQYVKNSIEIIDPVKKNLEEATNNFEAADKKLKAAQKACEDAIATVEKLNKQFREVEDNKNALINAVEEAKRKMSRAEELVKLLSGEQSRWKDNVVVLKQQVENLAGDSLIAAASICYNGPFIYEYRMALEKDWNKKIEELNIIHTDKISMMGLLKNEIEVNDWKLCGLPNDNLSIENGIIITHTRRWPLMIDPQNQGGNYIKKLGKKKDIIVVIKASAQNFLTHIKGAMNNGKWVLLENVSATLDPTLEPVLNGTNAKREVKIGDEIIKVHEKFKLHLCTTIPNPHYSPETFVKVTIVNFGITPTGLEEQMMTLLINNEMPELEQRKNAILIENFESTKELKKTEDGILKELTSTEGGNINKFLETDDLIEKLKNSKTKSEEINQKIQESQITNETINKEREKYRPAASRASILFFATLDLSSIDPMYQFSLQWFAKLYEFSIKATPNSSNKDTRIANLNKIFTKNLYENVCRSLFEKDKLLFSFVICYKLILGEKGKAAIPDDLWHYFLAGPSGDIQIPKNPTEWINKNEWDYFYRQLYYMDRNFSAMNGLESEFMSNPDLFKSMYDSVNPHTEKYPGEWNERIKDFMKLCFIKMLRPDKLISAIQLWIESNMSKEFIEPPPFELAKSFKNSSNIVPLIFILSPGSDPINDIQKFAEDMGFDKDKFLCVSLGRGQEEKAKNCLENMRTAGGWVLLQNCHLAQSFMGKLEEIVENFDTNWPDKDFRLWLTSMSTPFFPVSILQNSVKITVEPAKGLKNNILRNYKKIEVKELEEDCTEKDQYKTLLFGLSFFHAIVQDRRKYGPIGWNVKYDFTNEDWMVSRKQIKIFLEQYRGTIPYQVLDYLIGDINYGGRVTDDKDQRLIKTILSTYLTPQIFDYKNYKFSKSGTYFCPPPGEHDMYLSYVESLPVNSDPEVFGLNDNADIITAQNEGAALLDTILSIQPKTSAEGGKSRESIIYDLIEDIEKKIPDMFDNEAVKKQFPTDYNESLNTVLNQEVGRYNKLLETIKESIKTLKKALTGKIVMSTEYEAMSESLFINQVPVMWSTVFSSLKPLSSWVIDLSQRIKFFANWISNGKTPFSFWFSSFSFPQAFMTAVLQNYARSSKTAIDLLSFDFKIEDNLKPEDIKEKPENGVYVYGMFLEGARWNYDTHLLDDSLPKELYTDVPMIHFIPVKNREPPEKDIYNCPLYRVLSRCGTLSTTGHSTNYILYVELPTTRPQSVWIKAGVAMFLSLKQ